MNALMYSGGGGNTPASMSSLDIAALTGSRHDKVKLSIERMIERGVISQPPMGDVPETGANGRTYITKVYVFEGEQGKRDSIIVVAQLSPEFTARLVDRWAELERERVAGGHRLPRIDKAKEHRLTMQHNLKIAKMIGLDGNQAALSANRATAAITGIDTLSLMGVTHMRAPTNDHLLTPTEIGDRMGIGSGRKVNNVLCDMGLQTRFPSLKGGPHYEPTDAGVAAGAIMQDTNKQHSNGTPVRQLKWASSVCDVIAQYLKDCAA
jgi:phage regulator Rha-like protein